MFSLFGAGAAAPAPEGAAAGAAPREDGLGVGPGGAGLRAEADAAAAFERVLAEKDEEIHDLNDKITALHAALNKDDMDEFELAIAEKNKVLEEQLGQIEELQRAKAELEERLARCCDGAQAAEHPPSGIDGLSIANERVPAHVGAEETAEELASALTGKATAEAEAAQLRAELEAARAEARAAAEAASRAAEERIKEAERQVQAAAAREQELAARLEAATVSSASSAAAELQRLRQLQEEEAGEASAELRSRAEEAAKEVELLRNQLAVATGRLARLEEERRAERAVNGEAAAQTLRLEVARLSEALARERRERAREEARLGEQARQLQGADLAALAERCDLLRSQRDQARGIAQCIAQQSSELSGGFERLWIQGGNAGPETRTGSIEDRLPGMTAAPPMNMQARRDQPSWGAADPERTILRVAASAHGEQEDDGDAWEDWPETAGATSVPEAAGVAGGAAAAPEAEAVPETAGAPSAPEAEAAPEAAGASAAAAVEAVPETAGAPSAPEAESEPLEPYGYDLGGLLGDGLEESGPRHASSASNGQVHAPPMGMSSLHGRSGNGGNISSATPPVQRPPDEVTSGWDVFDPDDQIEYTVPTAAVAGPEMGATAWQPHFGLGSNRGTAPAAPGVPGLPPDAVGGSAGAGLGDADVPELPGSP